MEFKIDFPSSLDLRGTDYTILRYDITEDEFWKLSDEDTNYELIDGVLVIHSPASTEHEQIFSYLNRLIGFYVEEKAIGDLLGSRLVMRLDPKWNPEPDLMLVLSENRNKIKDTRVEGPADLVIEILSKATREIDLEKKVPKYLECGVKEIWIIDPENKEFSVYDGENKYTWDVTMQDLSIESKILPNFVLKPIWLWKRQDFPVNKIIKRISGSSDHHLD
ncbi:MAG: Uma2 family endonuclease [Promethearchaeota archaeon]